MGESVTGMQRYAIEVLRELDCICKPNELEIVVPKDVDPPQYRNIKVVRQGKKGSNKSVGGLLWEQTTYARYLRKSGRLGINLLAIVPVLMPHGLVVAHGVNYKVNPHFFKTRHDKLSRLFHIVDWSVLYRRTETIFTDTEFSKSEILKTYHIDESRITVAGCGWQHIERTEYAKDTFTRYPALKPGGYYFSMSSVNDNKNFKWIAGVATNNPDSSFAVAGGRSLQEYFERVGAVQPANLEFLGYVSDEDAKTLMANCKAFLFPTFYEGFGIPPMEAMACGAPAIVSDTPTMHEVYGNTVRYIDPYNPNIHLDEIMSVAVHPAVEVLSKDSWKSTAEKMYSIIRSGGE